MRATGLVVCLVIGSGCGSDFDLESAPEENDSALVASQSLDEQFTPSTGVLEFPNSAGILRTFSTAGPIDENNPFFAPLGTNGRACSTCHIARDAWSITPATVQKLFFASDGTHPLFRTVDGSNSPLSDVSTAAARKAAYSMLLKRAVVRIGLPIPPGAEFELIGVDDPYGYASAAELSLFRRVLPAANLKFLPAVMWDGRETFAGNTMPQNLQRQANTATVTHAQAAQNLSVEQQQQIVNFELSLFAANSRDRAAKSLTALGATGGPEALEIQPFHRGINDTFGGDPKGNPFTPIVFTLFDGWAGEESVQKRNPVHAARASVFRGQRLFNTKQFTIENVKGINDDFKVPTLIGTCSTCHNAFNSGGKSQPPPQDIGVADGARRTYDVPLYTLREKATGTVLTTTDPGRALVTGKWKDVGRFKTPGLRGLSAHAPFFHDGSAPDLRAVVDFYEQRFAIGLTESEKADMTAFLRAL